MKKLKEKKYNNRIKEILSERVPEANIIVSRVMFILAWFTLWLWVLFKSGLLVAKGRIEDYTLLPFSAVFVIVPIICYLLKGRGRGTKYLLIILSVLYLTVFTVMSSYRADLLLTLPVILTLRYYNTNFTVFTFVLSILSLAFTTWFCVYGMDMTGITDLNNMFFTDEVTIKGFGYIFDDIIAAHPDKSIIFQKAFMFTFVPNFIYLFFITWIVIRIMKKNLSVLVTVDDFSQREANQKVELSEMQTRMMISQIKPHFVYNSLSSIAVLCTKDPEKAKQTTIDFTRYLRGNIDSLSSQKPIDFSSELEHTKNYVSIEKLRFGNKINVEFNIETIDFKIPALTLQPIVENAIKHGLRKKREGGTVRVDVIANDKSNIISVTDDGVGFDSELIDNQDETHVGIISVRKRIEELSSGKLVINSTPGVGTKITIIIPRGEADQ